MKWWTSSGGVSIRWAAGAIGGAAQAPRWDVQDLEGAYFVWWGRAGQPEDTVDCSHPRTVLSLAESVRSVPKEALARAWPEDWS